MHSSIPKNVFDRNQLAFLVVDPQDVYFIFVGHCKLVLVDRKLDVIDLLNRNFKHVKLFDFFQQSLLVFEIQIVDLD